MLLVWELCHLILNASPVLLSCPAHLPIKQLGLLQVLRVQWLRVQNPSLIPMSCVTSLSFLICQMVMWHLLPCVAQIQWNNACTVPRSAYCRCSIMLAELGTIQRVLLTQRMLGLIGLVGMKYRSTESMFFASLRFPLGFSCLLSVPLSLCHFANLSIHHVEPTVYHALH